MVLRRIKYFFEDLWDKITCFFDAILFVIMAILLFLFLASPIIIPIVIGYAVFVVVSSSIDPLVKGIIFVAYSIGLFLYGGSLVASEHEKSVKDVKDALDMCEKKVASITDDAKKCKVVRSSIESKVSDALFCIEAVRKKL